jgi:hypothetical protein
MTRLKRRLRDLEAQVIDRHGLVPHTEPWLRYWTEKICHLMDDSVPHAPGSIPLEAWDADIAAEDRAARTGE